jgi:hypothetical protein
MADSMLDQRQYADSRVTRLSGRTRIWGSAGDLPGTDGGETALRNLTSQEPDTNHPDQCCVKGGGFLMDKQWGTYLDAG